MLMTKCRRHLLHGFVKKIERQKSKRYVNKWSSSQTAPRRTDPILSRYATGHDAVRDLGASRVERSAPVLSGTDRREAIDMTRMLVQTRQTY